MSSAPPAPRVIAVVGPTAAGKSDLGVFLARRLGGEVINADSMQLYRGMDIGTAKLTPAERGGVPHHLLDIWDVTVAASVAEYQRLARARIDALLAEGRWPVLVGGSGLYVRGAVDKMEFPGTDPAVRARLEEELTLRGSGALHARLAMADPGAAQAILPSNGRRIVRALEVIEITGKPFTANLPGHDSVYDTLQIGVDVAAPSSTSASRGGWTGCGRPGSWTKCARWRRKACAPGARPPARSDTSRSSRRSPGSAPRTRPAPRPFAPPSASRAVRIHGSGATPGCIGSVGLRRISQNSRNSHWRCSNDRSQPDHVMASGRSGRHPGLRRRAIIKLRSTSEVRVGRARGDGGRPSRHCTRHRVRC